MAAEIPKHAAAPVGAELDAYLDALALPNEKKEAFKDLNARHESALSELRARFCTRSKPLSYAEVSAASAVITRAGRKLFRAISETLLQAAVNPVDFERYARDLYEVIDGVMTWRWEWLFAKVSMYDRLGKLCEGGFPISSAFESLADQREGFGDVLPSLEERDVIIAALRVRAAKLYRRTVGPPTRAAARSAAGHGPLAAEREAALKAYRLECKEHGVHITDTLIAHAARPTWNDRTPVQRWKRGDPRSTSADDQAIRRVLRVKPHLKPTSE